MDINDGIKEVWNYKVFFKTIYIKIRISKLTSKMNEGSLQSDLMMNINIFKTKIIVFEKRIRKYSALVVNRESLEQVTEFVFLGSMWTKNVEG